METKKGKAGAPKKKDAHKKKSMTCSINESTNKAALKLYKSRGKAIELSVKYSDIILNLEAKNKD